MALCFGFIIMPAKKSQLTPEKAFRSVYKVRQVLIQIDSVQPSHEFIMSQTIPPVQAELYQYDTIYVTCNPKRPSEEIKTVYSVTGRVWYIFLCFSPKKNISDQTHIIYDPQGDSLSNYLNWAAHFHVD